MQILADIIASLPDGEVENVFIGLHWTAVVVRTGCERRCGLAATLREEHGKIGKPDVPDAGNLTRFTALQLAQFVLTSKGALGSIGMAAINALLPQFPDSWIDCNANEMILKYGKNKRVALIGHFSFVDDLRSKLDSLTVLEQKPQSGDLPAEAAPEILPMADVVAITGMTLTNHTLEGLLALCSPSALVMILGPSTPLSPLLFDRGVNLLSGVVVTEPDPVIRALMEGANFRQIRRVGARLVTMVRDKTVFNLDYPD